MVMPIKSPQPNILSQGAAAVGRFLLLNDTKDVWVGTNAGAPANGDGNGWCGVGSLIIDDTNGDLYQNVGTLAATVWQSVSLGTGPKLDTITAHAGGGKASATPLVAGLNRITVCATNGDSVLMPPAVSGAEVVVINDGAANAQVFGQGTDTIDGVATATGVVLTAAKRDIFFCLTAGAWQSLEGVKSV